MGRGSKITYNERAKKRFEEDEEFREKRREDFRKASIKRKKKLNILKQTKKTKVEEK